MTYKIVTGKDGKMSTEQGPVAGEAQRSLEKTRRELKDMIAGNTPFHTDNIGKSTPPPLVPPPEDWDESYPYGQWGLFP